MGLSPDPAKRSRQLANLQRAWPKVVAKHGLDGKQDPPSPPDASGQHGHPPASASPAQTADLAAAPTPAPVSVVAYSEPSADPPAPKPAARKPKRARKPPQGSSQPEPPAEPEPVDEKPERDGFWAGFLSGPGY